MDTLRGGARSSGVAGGATDSEDTSGGSDSVSLHRASSSVRSTTISATIPRTSVCVIAALFTRLTSSETGSSRSVSHSSSSSAPLLLLQVGDTRPVMATRRCVAAASGDLVVGAESMPTVQVSAATSAADVALSVCGSPGLANQLRIRVPMLLLAGLRDACHTQGPGCKRRLSRLRLI